MENTRVRTIMIISVGLIIIITLGSINFVITKNNRKNKDWKDNSKRLIEKITQLQVGDEVIFSELADFKWDKLYFIDAYASKESIKERLGVEFKWAGPSYHEGYSDMVFMENGRVVAYLLPWNDDYSIVYDGYRFVDEFTVDVEYVFKVIEPIDKEYPKVTLMLLEMYNEDLEKSKREKMYRVNDTKDNKDD